MRLTTARSITLTLAVLVGLPACAVDRSGLATSGDDAAADDAAADGAIADGGLDTGPPDIGPPDIGPPDIGPPDSGPADAPPTDAGCDPAAPASCDDGAIRQCVDGRWAHETCAIDCGGDPPGCMQMLPSNVRDRVSMRAASAPLDMTGATRATWNIDTDTGRITASNDGADPVEKRAAGTGDVGGLVFETLPARDSGGAPLGVLVVDELFVPTDYTLHGSGSRALVILVGGEARIDGRLSVRGPAAAGAGGGGAGDSGAGAGAGGGGDSDTWDDDDGGGGGGGFGAAGGKGGRSDRGGAGGGT